MPEATSLQRALDPHLEADREDEQLGLFAPPATAAGEARAAQRGYRGFGRPPGSRNRRTARTVELILARHRDPRVVLAEMAEANVYDLAALLGCSPYEAWQEKRLAAIGLLPYVAARITPELVDNRQVINLHLAAPGGGGEAAAAARVLLDPGEYRLEAHDPGTAAPDGAANASPDQPLNHGTPAAPVAGALPPEGPS